MNRPVYDVQDTKMPFPTEFNTLASEIPVASRLIGVTATSLPEYAEKRQVLAAVSMPEIDSHVEAPKPPATAISLYPQAFDEGTVQGRVRALFTECLRESEDALSLLEEGAFLDIKNKLSLIGVKLAQAFALNEFNSSLRSITDYIRRAAIVQDVETLTVEQINAFCLSLRSLSTQPLISLVEAAKIRSKLARTGWRGDHEAVLKFILEILSVECSESTAATDTARHL